MTTKKGGRPSTGQVKYLFNREANIWQWHARFTVAGKRTPFRPIDVFGRDQEEQARACAAEHAKYFHDHGAEPEGITTVSAYAKDWLDAREGKVASIRDDRSRMRDHVLPIIGLYDVKTIDRERIE
jgi:hypothetical protein